MKFSFAVPAAIREIAPVVAREVNDEAGTCSVLRMGTITGTVIKTKAQSYLTEPD